MFLVLSATAIEQEALRQGLPDAEESVLAHRHCVRTRFADRPLVLLETGIGAVNTAQALTAALQTSSFALVLQVGVGGAYLPSGLDVGDLALATEENFGDLGVITPDGWQPADAMGIPVIRKGRDYFNRFPLEPNLVSQARDLVAGIAWDGPPPECRTGPFVTVQQCTGLASRGAELATRFSAICENMEGAAAAQVCTLYGVPFLEIRGISNRVEDRCAASWDLPLAARRAQQAARRVLEAIEP